MSIDWSFVYPESVQVTLVLDRAEPDKGERHDELLKDAPP